MTKLRVMLLLLVSLPAVAQSRWVHPGANGTLAYAQTPTGDRIVDFSYAGYRGGGVALPDVAAQRTLQPTGGDDSAAIQKALDDVAALPLVDGRRGAVVLAAGTFHCGGTLLLRASGVVLRGAGKSKDGGTTLELTGTPHMGIDVSGQFQVHKSGGATAITDAYVPSGTRTLHVADATGLHVGDTLHITKPVTAAWVKFMGMDRLSRAGDSEQWVGADLVVYRRISAVNGMAVELTVPLTDDIDAKFLEGRQAPVQRVEIAGQIAETGVESLRIVAPARTIAYQADAEFDGIHMENAVDSWLRDVELEDTTNSVFIGKGTERVTVVGVQVLRRTVVSSSAKNFDFSVNGSQILFDRIGAHGDKAFYFATQARQQGPVVVLHAKFQGDGEIEPHQRWSTGLLVDSCEVRDGGISLVNRGTMGSGHGWTIGWSVLWNNVAGEIVLQQPPGVANWSIGDKGSHKQQPMPVSGGPRGGDLPEGIVESAGKPVQPASLYLEQLRERLGPDAVTAIGYGQ